MNSAFYKALNFTKEPIGSCDVENYGFLVQPKMYKVYDGNDNELLGQLFYHEKVSFIAYADNDIKIEKLRIFDRISNIEIGGYQIAGGFWNGKRFAKMTLEKNDYKFEYSKLKRNKYIIHLGNESIDISYHLWIDYEKGGYNDINLRPISGFIDSNSQSLLPVFTGLLAIENELNLVNETDGIST